MVLSATVQFGNGIVGRIAAEGGRDVVLEGSRGTLTVAANGASIVAGGRVEPDRSTTSGRVLALRELRDALLDGTPTSLQPADALSQHAALFAMVQSHLGGGQRVALRDVDPALEVTGAVCVTRKV